ncbi:unnamed protein product, partial [Polarella glacialis]
MESPSLQFSSSSTIRPPTVVTQPVGPLGWRSSPKAPMEDPGVQILPMREPLQQFVYWQSAGESPVAAAAARPTAFSSRELGGDLTNVAARPSGPVAAGPGGQRAAPSSGSSAAPAVRVPMATFASLEPLSLPLAGDRQFPMLSSPTAGFAGLSPLGLPSPTGGRIVLHDLFCLCSSLREHLLLGAPFCSTG